MPRWNYKWKGIARARLQKHGTKRKQGTELGPGIPAEVGQGSHRREVSVARAESTS